MPHLTIGKLAERSGTSTDTLRYYEKMKLIEPQARSRNGYRLYHYDVVGVVQFIRRAKMLQFTLPEIRGLLSLSNSDPLHCKRILRFTEDKIREAQQKIDELHDIKGTIASVMQAPSHRSVMDVLHCKGKMLGIFIAAALSFCPDATLSNEATVEENELRVEETFKRGRFSLA